MGTSVPPPTPRIRLPGIAAVVADPILMIATLVGVAEITQEQVDLDDRKLEDYEASIARANSMILHHMEKKDMTLCGDWILPRRSGTNYRQTML